MSTILDLLNEILASAIVVIAASLSLYNLSRNWHNIIARTSGVLLATVTISYMCDVFTTLEPGYSIYAATLRLQWIGIAFMPAALFHLSDGLLATTGLPSRGRRRRIVRLLYLLSALFLILAAFTNLLIEIVPVDGLASVRARPLFLVYTAYFIVASLVAFVNVQRARQRCLTRDTRRRMGYLQIAMLTPSIGIFPFSVLLGPGQEFTLAGLLLVNLANILVILMLLFLAYPLSFFGSRVPDRVVKVDLLRFMLRGPGTGLLVLATIIFLLPTTRILGVSGTRFVPFAAVSVVLLWQWAVALALPWLEKRLVYPGEDDEQMSRLERLSDRLLTRNDVLQLVEAILASTCDYLRVNTAFIGGLNSDLGLDLVAAVGPTRPTVALLQEETENLTTLFNDAPEGKQQVYPWFGYWVTPLHSQRQVDEHGDPKWIGFLGVQARSAEVNLTEDEWQMLGKFTRRAAAALDDLMLQGEIFAALEGLLPQISLTRPRAADVEFKPGRAGKPSTETTEMPAVDRELFIDQVKAALKHYWGGPGMTSSRLLELSIVRDALPQHDENPAKALRSVLNRAIENQKPSVGDRRMDSPEWTIYNILDLRFIQRVKAREAAYKLHISEPNLYLKQRYALEAVADALIDMETEHRRASSEPAPAPLLPPAQ